MSWKSLDIEYGGQIYIYLANTEALYIYSEVQLAWLITANSLFVSLLNSVGSITFFCR